MRPAAERLADIMRVGANVETLAANDAEIDFRRGDPPDRIAIDMHQPRLALHGFSLPREFVKRHAALLDRRDHGRHLVEIARIFFRRRTDSSFIEWRYRSFFQR